jgi:Surface-adhesin protein E
MLTGHAFISLVVGLTFGGLTALSSPVWTFYAKSEYGSYQYDAKHVSHPSESVVRLQQKLILNDRSRNDLIGELGEESQNVKEIVILRKINCTARKSRMLGLIYFSDSGSIIKQESYEPIEWDSVIPDSVDDVLYHAICQ